MSRILVFSLTLALAFVAGGLALAEDSAVEACRALRAGVGASADQRSDAVETLRSRLCLWDAAAVAVSIKPTSVPNDTRLALGAFLAEQEHSAEALAFYEAASFEGVSREVLVEFVEAFSMRGWDGLALKLANEHFALDSADTEGAEATLDAYLRAKRPIDALHYAETRREQRLDWHLITRNLPLVAGASETAPGALWPDRFVAAFLEEYWLGHRFASENVSLYNDALADACRFWVATGRVEQGARVLRLVRDSLTGALELDVWAGAEFATYVATCWRQLGRPHEAERALVRFDDDEIGPRPWIRVGIELDRGRVASAQKLAEALILAGYGVETADLLGHSPNKTRAASKRLITALSKKGALSQQALDALGVALKEIEPDEASEGAEQPERTRQDLDPAQREVIVLLKEGRREEAMRLASAISDHGRAGRALLKGAEVIDGRRRLWRALDNLADEVNEDDLDALEEARALVGLVRESCRDEACRQAWKDRVRRNFRHSAARMLWP